MELRKIILRGEKQLTEAQQKLSRFITMYTKVQFMGSTLDEWQDWVEHYKPIAEEEAKKRAFEDAAVVKAAEEVHDAITPIRRKHKRHTHPNMTRTVRMDYDALYRLVKASNMTMTGVNMLLGQNSSYLAARHSKYNDEIPQSFVSIICDALHCTPDAFIPEMREEVKQPDLIEQAEAAPEPEMVDLSIGETLTAQIPAESVVGAVTKDGITLLVGATLTERLRGYAMFTGRGLEEIVNEAVDRFLDFELLMIGRSPDREA